MSKISPPGGKNSPLFLSSGFVFTVNALFFCYKLGCMWQKNVRSLSGYCFVMFLCRGDYCRNVYLVLTSWKASRDNCEESLRVSTLNGSKSDIAFSNETRVCSPETKIIDPYTKKIYRKLGRYVKHYMVPVKPKVDHNFIVILNEIN